MYAERKPPESPPCESCRVWLKVENKAAADIFMLIRGQCETRWNGERDIEICLNHLVVWKAIEKYPGKIADEWGCFLMVNRVWHQWKKWKEDNQD